MVYIQIIYLKVYLKYEIINNFQVIVFFRINKKIKYGMKIICELFYIIIYKNFIFKKL